MTHKDDKNIIDILSRLAKQDYCYLTTTGRKTGTPHEVEIWFGVHRNSIYLLSGGRDKSDWVKNLLADPRVTVRIAKQTFTGLARIVSDGTEDLMARHLLAGKYQEWKDGQPLSEWGSTALVVEIELDSKKTPSSRK